MIEKLFWKLCLEKDTWILKIIEIVYYFMINKVTYK
jgi:hypothetical protein